VRRLGPRRFAPRLGAADRPPGDGGHEQPDDDGHEQPDDGGHERPDDGGHERPDDGGHERPDDGGHERPGDRDRGGGDLQVDRHLGAASSRRGARA
jgi:hypothetical protein